MNEKEVNKDSNKLHEEEKYKEEGERKYAEEARGVAEVNVKNANASGDGSMNRNDEELPSDGHSSNAEID